MIINLWASEQSKQGERAKVAEMPDFSNLRKPFYWKAADLSGKEINNTQMRNVINADPTISATRTCQSVHTRPKSGDIQVTIQFDDDLTTPAQTDALTTLLTGAGYTYQAVGTGRVFQAYTTTSVNTYTTSWIDVEFDVQNLENVDIYSHTTGTAEVTFLAAGDYEVRAARGAARARGLFRIGAVGEAEVRISLPLR